MDNIEYKYVDDECSSGLGIYMKFNNIPLLLTYQGLVKFYHSKRIHPTEWSWKRGELDEIKYYL